MEEENVFMTKGRPNVNTVYHYYLTCDECGTTFGLVDKQPTSKKIICYPCYKKLLDEEKS